MIVNSWQRSVTGEEQVHYFGKWPFVRVLGIQELFSSIFSCLNGLPYALLLLSPALRSHRARSLPMWRLHSAVFTFTWSQSALFHARESPTTEALDYHGATLGLAVSLVGAIVANCPERWSLRRCMALACSPVLAFWVGHVLYLTYIDFDYGYNMVIAVALGIGTSLAWIIWTVRFSSTRPFAWKVLFAVLGPYIVLPLELLDFPPLFGFLDAHALWHFGTIPMAFMWRVFLLDYLRYETLDATKDA